MIESLSFGKRPTEAAAILAASVASAAEGPASNGKTGDASDYGYLASGSRDRTVRLWDALKGQCLMVFAAHENWVRSVVLHPNGKFIISCSDDKSIRVLDLKESRCLRTIADAHTHFITCIAMAQSNPILVSGSVDKNVAIWACN